MKSSYRCSGMFLKRCLVVLLTLTIVLLILTVTRNSMFVGKENLVFEGPTERKPNTGGHKKTDDLTSAVDSLSSFIQDITGNGSKDKAEFGVNNTHFHSTLRARASPDGVIVLSSVDSGYVDLALNLYFSSFKKLGITNYLFVGSDAQVCQIMSKYDIACFDYIHDRDGNKSSGYFSKAFKRKTHLKTKIILEALKLGLKVLITDADIVFLKNPIPYLTCSQCDIEISSDVIEGNSGFYMARPTTSAIKLHNEAWVQGLAKPEISNQKTIDRLIAKMQKKKAIKVKNLSSKLFANGKIFFEDGLRMFKGENPCKDCIIVHNNWIVTGEAKIYRFKEYGLWEMDFDRYYSSEDRNYLSFDMPVDFGAKDTSKRELSSLNIAFIMADLLNRTLILPRLHCYGCKYISICKKKDRRCTFGTFYRIETLNKNFKDKYRENVFLSHPLVPQGVKKSLSPPYLVKSANSDKYFPEVAEDVEVLTPSDVSVGPTAAEIVEWFGNDKNSHYSVLRFHSIYNSLKMDELFVKEHPIVQTVKGSFKPANFRQI